MDSRSIGYLVGLAVGVIVGVAIVFIAIRKMNERNSKGSFFSEYDERQKVIRGQGYMYGFYAMMIYFVILMVADMLLVKFPASMQIIAFTGIIVGICVDCVYCIWKGAYWGLNNNKKKYGAFMSVAGVLNFLIAYMQYRNGMLLENGELSTGFINLLCGIMLLVIGVAVWARAIADKRVPDEEEEE